MGFTDQQIDSFIALYKREFGEVIDRAEALRQATSLVSLVKITYKPMTRSDYIKYAKMALDIRSKDTNPNSLQ